MGADRTEINHIGLFQFTPLREGRQAAYAVYMPKKDFNSRPSARGDLTLAIRSKIDLYISIHAPPRGATHGRKEPGETVEFQFTPLREGRRLRVFLCASGTHISIHAPPRGATIGLNDKDEKRQFQFTPLREGRRGKLHYIAHCGISIHAPPRGATGAVG